MATQQGGSQSSVSPEGISAIVGIPDEPVQDISSIVGIPDNAVAMTRLQAELRAHRAERLRNAKEEEYAMVDCVFGCGPPRPTSQMANTGTTVNPRWMCHPCNGARKAIEHVARNDPDLKANLNAFKKKGPGAVAAKGQVMPHP